VVSLRRLACWYCLLPKGDHEAWRLRRPAVGVRLQFIVSQTMTPCSTRSFRKMSHRLILDCVCRGTSRMIGALLLALVALAGTSRGQTVTVDFQDLSLGPNSYWNGSDGSGGFTSRGAHFNNSYDTTYGDWSG